MDSIGDLLKSAREERGYSIDQIARDTNIAKRYLRALEEEDFTVFPGETYLIGFLRTYSEHLDLDPNTVINLYKNLRIQEQPVPMTELIETRKDRGRAMKIAIICVVVAGLAAGGYFLIPGLLENRKAQAGNTEEAETAEVYRFDEEVLEQRFLEGDILEMIIDEKPYRISLTSVDDTLSMETPGGPVQLTIGQERILDLDGVEGGDVKVFLRDLDPGAGAAVLHFDKFLQSTVTLSNRESAGEEAVAEESPEKVKAVEDNSGIPLGSTLLEEREVEPVVVLESESPEPFTIDVVFRGYCLVRYLSDGTNRDERYFHKGETFRLDVSREVRLWISNAGSFKAKISGVDVDLGKPGEVSTKLIRWIPDETGDIYRLTIVQAY